ncbi:aminotransferase class V-fold PLP-dependent enzyme [Paenibacillus psychroresistens]|uniref:cysteine desulfurase n=1 Tax=Paenibacillus psychroresistens TaxID=1778678 RepID=A0A6B8RWZ5_9BACL|nr:aminotransferase class V-fold PLP-dependent enzyme [Paenibacillus psychroresistens]QGQ99883.1 aminotransferase class V-fold PLP-dependent enzyme [Paenibacillus psychroresistens]
MKTYYFDNAASSWPKPKQVVEAMTNYLTENGANPGRGSHQMAVNASRALFETRKSLAKLFGISNPNDICYTMNTTEALNLAIKGALKEGDHVITTSIEHNSVRRPLEYLRKTKNIEITYIQSDITGNVNPVNVRAAIKHNTKLVICSHSSNLLGTIVPLSEIAEICRDKKLVFLVDAAQTAGTLPIDVQKMGISMLAFPGHKGLLGPQGTGGLYIHPELDLEPLLQGGTGSQSEAIEQPLVRPDRYEAGTQNTVGIVGLNEGIKVVLEQTVEAIHAKEWSLSQRLMEGIKEIKGIQIIGPAIGEDKTGIVSFVMEQVDASELAFILDHTFQIAVRAGFHCTPLGHQTAGTTETGAVRASVGFYTTEDEVAHFVQSIKEISKHYTK